MRYSSILFITLMSFIAIPNSAYAVSEKQCINLVVSLAITGGEMQERYKKRFQRVHKNGMCPKSATEYFKLAPQSLIHKKHTKCAKLFVNDKRDFERRRKSGSCAQPLSLYKNIARTLPQKPATTQKKSLQLSNFNQLYPAIGDNKRCVELRQANGVKKYLKYAQKGRCPSVAQLQKAATSSVASAPRK